MVTPLHTTFTAAQVGTYFVGQYYQTLQQQPEYGYRFYSDASKILRIDGDDRKAATALVQIQEVIMSLNFSGIEIKTAHSLESWNGGVQVMVSGSVHLKETNRRRKFVQSFFLAPQETGYFVLSDFFLFVDEDQILHDAYLTQNNLVTKPTAPNSIQDHYHGKILHCKHQSEHEFWNSYKTHKSKLQTSPVKKDTDHKTFEQLSTVCSLTMSPNQVSKYTLDGDLQDREYAAPRNIVETNPVNNYGFAEEQLQQINVAENIIDNNIVIHSTGSLPCTINTVQNHLNAPVETHVREPQKETYASILAKGRSIPVEQPSPKVNAPSEWQDMSESPSQPWVASANHFERSKGYSVDESSAMKDDDKFKSVYVRNVPTTMANSEIEEEFKKFGKLSPAGVAIRSRKDTDGCYAFVEYDDITGVQNAIKASTIEIGGHQLYIEGRRPNRNGLAQQRFVGGRWLQLCASDPVGSGRGRGDYRLEGMSGRFVDLSFGRGTGKNGGDREYNVQTKRKGLR